MKKSGTRSLSIPAKVVPTEKKQTTDAIQNDKRITKLYIEFRSNPLNERFEDGKFCSEHGCSLEQLSRLKTIDVIQRIQSRPIKESELRQSVEQLLKLAYGRSMQGAPVKSLEGLLNAFTNLLKQQALQTGRPTERIEIEELAKKSPKEIHRFIMNQLRTSIN